MAGAAEPDGPFMLVSEEGFLHVVPDLPALAVVSREHGLRNQYMRNMVGVPSSTARRDKCTTDGRTWQELEKCRWLKHLDSGKIVVVVGGPANFVRTFGMIRERVGLRGVEPPHETNVKKLLAQVLARPQPSSTPQARRRSLTPRARGAWQTDEEAAGGGALAFSRWVKWTCPPQAQLDSLRFANCSTCGITCACLFSLDCFSSSSVKKQKVHGIFGKMIARPLDERPSSAPPPAPPSSAPDAEPSPPPSCLAPLATLDRTKFQPMSDWDFASCFAFFLVDVLTLCMTILTYA